MLDKTPKKCLKCGDVIINRQSNATYCSITCQEERRNKNYTKTARAVPKYHFYNPAYLEQF